MQRNFFGKVVSGALGAVLFVLLVAGVARAAYWLLAPLVPALLALAILGFVYWFLFRGRRG